jgi:serine phosphatase RsbU (regulator of sigma subunit)
MAVNRLNTGFPRINVALLLVVATVICNLVFTYYLINRSKARIAEMTTKINPYLELLNELTLMVTESKMYATNWVYLQNSVEDKEKLRVLHQRGYPELKKKLHAMAVARGKTEDANMLARVFGKFSQLVDVETTIMHTLVGFDDYENPQKKFGSEDLIESEVLPRTEEIMSLVQQIVARNRQEAAVLKAGIENDTNRMLTAMLVCSLGLLLLILASVAFISGGIRRPVLRMKEIVERLARGQQVKEQLRSKKDVVGEMISAVNGLSDSLRQTSSFANEIGRGNLSVPYEKLSDEDVLGMALINMRDSLRAYSEDMEEKVRERTAEVIEKSKKLENAYKEIRDSINYAKRIQESILPANDLIKEVFPESFIFYKPKDVVCGDFYWFGRSGNDVVLAAVDCTGHGVPGALMTVIGNSLLNQIITSSGVTSPREILYKLDSKLYDTLKQHGGSVTSDGMDIAVCHYKVGSGRVSFAGAKRPLYLMRGGKLSEIKGSRAPIGLYNEDGGKQFDEHEIKVEENDIVYLFSDGIQDQFGGYEGKKYMISRFRELLYDMQRLNMSEQRARVEKELDAWQRDHEQTDDMLLMGIRF